MSKFNNSKKKWEVAMTFVALALCTVGLASFSVISYFQTMYAFKPLNDSTIPVIGKYIAVGLAFIFQYGQNAALYYKARFASGRHVFTFLFWNVTDKTICTAIFGMCALIDAGTNILWLESNTTVLTMKWYFQLLVYLVMVAVVFVEEVMGSVLHSTSHAYKELKEIIDGEQGGEGNHPQQQPQQDTQPKHNNERHQKQTGSERRQTLERSRAEGMYHGEDRRHGGGGLGELEAHKRGQNNNENHGREI